MKVPAGRESRAGTSATGCASLPRALSRPLNRPAPRAALGCSIHGGRSITGPESCSRHVALLTVTQGDTAGRQPTRGCDRSAGSQRRVAAQGRALPAIPVSRAPPKARSKGPLERPPRKAPSNARESRVRAASAAAAADRGEHAAAVLCCLVAAEKAQFRSPPGDGPRPAREPARSAREPADADRHTGVTRSARIAAGSAGPLIAAQLARPGPGPRPAAGADPRDGRDQPAVLGHTPTNTRAGIMAWTPSDECSRPSGGQDRGSAGSRTLD